MAFESSANWVGVRYKSGSPSNQKTDTQSLLERSLSHAKSDSPRIINPGQSSEETDHRQGRLRKDETR